MKYFFDTEFIEYPPNQYRRGTIDLISIGIVAEDYREYYAIHNDFKALYANAWVKENVIDKLEPLSVMPRKSLAQIAKDIMEFAPPKENPEFYAYFCSYDWVAFCWIFGAMVDLPKGYPMYCRDLKYLMKIFGINKEDLPQQDPRTHHNALADARWNRNIFLVLDSVAGDINTDMRNTITNYKSIGLKI